jgi:hypothetical protein
LVVGVAALGVAVLDVAALGVAVVVVVEEEAGGRELDAELQF